MRKVGTTDTIVTMATRGAMITTEMIVGGTVIMIVTAAGTTAIVTADGMTATETATTVGVRIPTTTIEAAA